MGSRLSPDLAKTFIEDFVVRAIDSTFLKSTICLEYIEEKFVIWRDRKKEPNRFLNLLNSSHQKSRLRWISRKFAKFPRSTSVHKILYLSVKLPHHPTKLTAVSQTLVIRSQKLADTTARKKFNIKGTGTTFKWSFRQHKANTQTWKTKNKENRWRAEHSKNHLW